MGIDCAGKVGLGAECNCSILVRGNVTAVGGREEDTEVGLVQNCRCLARLAGFGRACGSRGGGSGSGLSGSSSSSSGSSSGGGNGLYGGSGGVLCGGGSVLLGSGVLLGGCVVVMLLLVLRISHDKRGNHSHQHGC